MHYYWHIMEKCAAVAKKELFYFWPFGLAAWLGGVVFIDRKKSSESYNTLFETAQLMQVDKVRTGKIYKEGFQFSYDSSSFFRPNCSFSRKARGTTRQTGHCNFSLSKEELSGWQSRSKYLFYQ